jgi:hypothetical protein
LNTSVPGEGYPRDPDLTTHLISQIAHELQGQTSPEFVGDVEAAPPPPEALEMTVPINIDVLVDSHLRLTEMPGNDTKKYTVEGHPDLLVRHEVSVPYDDYAAAQHVTRIKGVNVVPHALWYHYDRETYVVTKFVQGRPLDEVLADNPSEALVQAVDATWEALVNGLVQTKLEGKEWPEDIDACHQFMLGTIPDDPTPRLWLVDIPYYTISLNGPGEYGSQALFMANAINKIEELSGKRMSAARQALQNALQHCEDDHWTGNGLEQAVRYVLEHDNTQVSPLDNDVFLNTLRTR